MRKIALTGGIAKPFQHAIDEHCFNMAFVRVDPLLDPIRRGIQHNALPIIAATTMVRVSSLGDRAESLGAAAIVIKGALAGND